MFKKFFMRLMVVICSLMSLVPTTKDNMPSIGIGCDIPLYRKIIELFLPNKEPKLEIEESRETVYISGYPIGFSIDGAGAVIVEKSAVITENGHVYPKGLDGLMIGDIIKEINGVAITSGESICNIVNLEENIGKELNVTFIRNNEEMNTLVKAEYDIFAKSYRLGLWVRDNAVGVGMMTYLTKNGSFGALGHPITDIDTGAIIPVSGGRTYRCSIIGVRKGEKGNPGELKGLFLKTSNTVGDVAENNKYGVYGKIDEEYIKNYCTKEVEVARDDEVEIGSATILSTVDGVSPKEYKIEIIKTNYTNSDGQNCMVIRIVDEELLAITGGIVQGMSGSPIMQNGRIIGCVTHVFVNDPKKGFAGYLSNMLQ